MHKLIEELQEYHVKKFAVLSKIQSLANELLNSDQPEPIVESLRNIINDFGSSSEKTHHHNEELILAQLQQTETPLHRKVEEISADHQAFAHIVARLLRQIDEHSADTALIANAINDFIKNYEDHANTEELMFFPAAEQNLTDKAWGQNCSSVAINYFSIV